MGTFAVANTLQTIMTSPTEVPLYALDRHGSHLIAGVAPKASKLDLAAVRHSLA